jgi:hypothetical protein
MTHHHVRALLQKQGMSFRKTGDEFRVNYKGGDEATAYYTNDLADALATGLDMARRSTKQIESAVQAQDLDLSPSDVGRIARSVVSREDA